MILVLLLACASCGSSAPTPQEVTVPDTGHVVEDDAPTAPPAEDVVTPAKEQKADDAGAGEGEAPEVDPDAPLTHGDLQAILDLAADAGAGASAAWIQAEGPRAPGPFGTTRAEFLDWMKTLAAAFGAGVMSVLVVWLRRWFEPLKTWLAEQPHRAQWEEDRKRLRRQLEDQKRVSAKLRRALDERVARSPLGARKKERKPPAGTTDFRDIGLATLYED